MSTVTIAAQITGNLDTEDRVAMDYAISVENARRAALTPPLPALPFSNPAERRASYAAILTPRLIAAHAANVATAVEAGATSNQFKDLKKRWSSATQAQRDAALAALPAS